jgi:hypothetical protein
MGTIKHAGRIIFDYFNSGLPARFIAWRCRPFTNEGITSRFTSDSVFLPF